MKKIGRPAAIPCLSCKYYESNSNSKFFKAYEGKTFALEASFLIGNASLNRSKTFKKQRSMVNCKSVKCAMSWLINCKNADYNYYICMKYFYHITSMKF